MEYLLGFVYSLLGIMIYLWIFWGFYVLVMGIYRAYLANKLSKFLIFMSFPFIIVGLVLDVLSNFFVATFVFLEVPHEWLVTSRLVRYQTVLDAGDWRHRYADWICVNLLDVFDPNGTHCLKETHE